MSLSNHDLLVVDHVHIGDGTVQSVVDKKVLVHGVFNGGTADVGLELVTHDGSNWITDPNKAVIDIEAGQHITFPAPIFSEGFKMSAGTSGNSLVFYSIVQA
jgi:hypothetical protein